MILSLLAFGTSSAPHFVSADFARSANFLSLPQSLLRIYKISLKEMKISTQTQEGVAANS